MFKDKGARFTGAFVLLLFRIRRDVMSKKRKLISFAVWLSIVFLLLAAILLTEGTDKHETVREVMRDAVLHDSNKISLFGITEVNPGLISAYAVTAILLGAALILRIFVIPRFRYVPTKLQLLIEQTVKLFDGLGESNSPHKHGFLNVYIFGAGVYVFFGTLFELFGIQVMTAQGVSVALPAPLSDINAAIAIGCLSYLVIMSGGISSNGLRGVGRTLKDFSLPVSMSFRLFGALLSGLLVTELVYYYSSLSYVLPVVVAVLFTILHALIQTYVLTMLTSLFYGEVSEIHNINKNTKRRQQL